MYGRLSHAGDFAASSHSRHAQVDHTPTTEPLHSGHCGSQLSSLYREDSVNSEVALYTAPSSIVIITQVSPRGSPMEVH